MVLELPYTLFTCCFIYLFYLLVYDALHQFIVLLYYRLYILQQKCVPLHAMLKLKQNDALNSTCAIDLSFECFCVLCFYNFYVHFQGFCIVFGVSYILCFLLDFVFFSNYTMCKSNYTMCKSIKCKF
ncbi:cytochrome-c oxidase subunit III [Heliothis zea nudivirus]|uniref:Cytochrome-c oxidase subunit III n=1 Tax=Heliothis zea nudivirus 1 TaxID=3116536 RepID=Q8JKN2_9VIRU|nr:cytochrome-c oxidase subunit III [Heliothis zea nudivirus]AAN04375.1 cytochrome-c oxidase subunit III [Heliothis zea nudivirus]